MRIIFICGSLEPGKDGVGDYTRRLCGTLLMQGVSVGILAYNDKYISNRIEEYQQAEGYDVPCLRLPHVWKSKIRCIDAKGWIDLHDPEWLSLQFVPYAFHEKGIPIRTGSILKEIGYKRKWHIMIHELWIGMSHQSSFKEKCIGKVQKVIIKQLLSKLAPKVINTQTELYQHQLQKLGFKASILPLFSNIPCMKYDVQNVNKPALNLPTNYLVLFGSIHKHAPIEEFVKELGEFDTERGFSFVALGRNGSELEYWKSVIEKYGFNLIVVGEQSTESISYVLSLATFGLATTPYYLIQKSGAVAAMHEHNLPVICFSKPWVPINFNNKISLKGVVEYKPGNLEACIQNKSKIDADEINTMNVSKLFLTKLKID